MEGEAMRTRTKYRAVCHRCGARLTEWLKDWGAVAGAAHKKGAQRQVVNAQTKERDWVCKGCQ